MIFIRTWNVLGWSCSRKSLIRIHIWRNYVIKGVGKLFKGVVAKRIYHYGGADFQLISTLNWWPWLTSGDGEWPTATGHSSESDIFKIHILKGQAPVSMKLLFISENGFWTNAIEFPNILYCYVTKVGFVCFYIFSFCLRLLISTLPSSRVRRA